MTFGEEVVEFLNAIDPEELEREALDRLQVWGESSPTAAILEVLKEWMRDL